MQSIHVKLDKSDIVLFNFESDRWALHVSILLTLKINKNKMLF